MAPPEPRASRGDGWPGLLWGRDLPSGGPGSGEPRAALLPACLLPPSLPFGLRAFSPRSASLPAPRRTAFLFASTVWFSLALSLSSTLKYKNKTKQKTNSDLSRLLVETPGPTEAKWGFAGIRGNELGAFGPAAPRRSGNWARFCVTSAHGVIYLPWASVSMTDFHRGQKASLRQSILERSLIQQTRLVVLFLKALEINTPGGAPAWAAREEHRNIHCVN